MSSPPPTSSSPPPPPIFTPSLKTAQQDAVQPRQQAAAGMLRALAFVALFACLLLAPRAVGAREITLNGGYGLLGAPSPFARLSISFGKRVVFDFNGGVVFADPENVRFTELTNAAPVKEKLSFVKIPDGDLLYSVGVEVRGFVRKNGKKHNAYIGAGADWLPQLNTYYPGVKAVAGYQLALLKKRNLVMRFGSEYYLYGVVPANTLSVTSSVGYKF